MAAANRKTAKAVPSAGATDAPATPAGERIPGTHTSESGSASGGGMGRAPTAGNDAPAAQPASGKFANCSHLRVRALRPPGIRRAGRHWPAGEVVVPAGDFSDAQIEALLAEAALKVEIVLRKDAD